MTKVELQETTLDILIDALTELRSTLPGDTPVDVHSHTCVQLRRHRPLLGLSTDKEFLSLVGVTRRGLSTDMQAQAEHDIYCAEHHFDK